MGINAFQGIQCVGKLTLSNGSLGPSPIPIFAGGRNTATPYTLAANERICILALVVTSTDTTNEIVTITDGAPTHPTTLFTCSVSASAPSTLTVPPGVLLGYAATNLVATAGAVTSGKNIAITLQGLVVHR